MDALVAKEVMGYPVEFEENPATGREAKRVWFIVAGDDRPNRSTTPNYSTDIEAA